MEKLMEKIFPLWGVEQDCIVSKQGDISMVFKVALPELFTLSDQDYTALHQAWVRALKVLPAHTVFHKQDYFTKTAFQPGIDAEADFLNRSSDQFFTGRPYLDHVCYVILTKKPKGRKEASSMYSSLLRGSMVPEELLKQETLEAFQDTASQFERILSDSGLVSLTRLKEEALGSQKNRMGLIERYCTLSQGPRFIQDIQLVPDLKVGSKHVQLFALSENSDLPDVCGPRINYDRYSTDHTKFSIGFASAIGHLLDCDHILNQYLFIEDAQKTLHTLERKRLRLQSLAAYSRENSISLEATNAFLNEAIAEHRLPVKAHFNILTWTDDKEKLQELRNLVASSLAQMDATARQETVGAPQIFWAGIPGNAADFPMNECFDTFAEQACCFLNLETSYRTSKSPFGLRLGDRLSGRPLHVDLSDEPVRLGITTNRNKVVIGGSGSGKSMFMNHLLHSYFLQGAHCLVVDVGHSYQGLCELVGGYYFTYTDENPIRFNPFYIAEGDSLDIEKKESIKTMLLALWKREDEEFKRSEYVALSNALNLYYQYLSEHPKVFPCFDSFYEFLLVDFAAVLEKDGVKEKDFDLDSFLFVLRPYYDDGEFAYLLNARENLDVLHQPFVVFELDNVKENPILFPVITLIIMELFIGKMRKLQGIRKIIVLEEAWKAISKAGMAEFIRYLYKTVRKHFGEAITVTQEVDDILDNPIVKESIVGNADCKILLDLKKFQNKFDGIQKALGLTDKGKSLVLSVNKANDPTKRYRELYVELGGQIMKVYRFEPSPEEYYAYTTEQTEKVKVREYADKHGGVAKGIRALVAELKRP
ncbi:TraG family conjugative transposon ATPase [Ravibacter arvi]|uniref:TraG family conjugative transposon ATPase n=1 Tax=Ravibacter arvi TaxID=2051041 RepID=A0ABP8LM80_9BACT